MSGNLCSIAFRNEGRGALRVWGSRSGGLVVSCRLLARFAIGTHCLARVAEHVVWRRWSSATRPGTISQKACFLSRSVIRVWHSPCALPMRGGTLFQQAFADIATMAMFVCVSSYLVLGLDSLGSRAHLAKISLFLLMGLARAVEAFWPTIARPHIVSAPPLFSRIKTASPANTLRSQTAIAAGAHVEEFGLFGRACASR